MKKQTEQQLLSDGQRIRKQAENRLQSIDFQHRLNSHINNQTASIRPNKNHYFGLAAAVCFSVLLGSWLMNSQPETENSNRLSSATTPIQLKITQIPMTIEQSINQTLLDEQQAIINDFKTLQQQLLSI